MGGKKNKKKKAQGGGGGGGEAAAPPLSSTIITPAHDEALKEASLSIAHNEKKKGNEEYLKQNYIAAIEHYTRGIAVSVCDPSLLGTLLANRSVAFIRIKVQRSSLWE